MVLLSCGSDPDVTGNIRKTMWLLEGSGGAVVTSCVSGAGGAVPRARAIITSRLSLRLPQASAHSAGREVAASINTSTRHRPECTVQRGWPGRDPQGATVCRAAIKSCLVGAFMIRATRLFEEKALYERFHPVSV